MPHNTRTRRPPCTIYSLISTSTPNKTCTQKNSPMATCGYRQPQTRSFTTSFTQTFTIDSSIHTMWYNIKSILTDLQEQHVPSKFTTTRFHQPWITTEIKRITRRKQRAYNRSKKEQSQQIGPQPMWFPYLKKGDRLQPINYRPISLTSITCKMLEHIITRNIMQHLDTHNIHSTGLENTAQQKHSLSNS